MESGSGQPIELALPLCADRMGVARLTKIAVAGIDLCPLWKTLIARLIDGTIKAGEGIDLSLIAQLLGDKPAGLAIQHEILVSHQLFRSPCAVMKPRLRVLALAAATDRPRASLAGAGLAKLDDHDAIEHYLDARPEREFFIARFVDYSSRDGLFRKYRIVFIDGRPYACHMAIADRWDIWYLNAGVSASQSKRLEEQTFMQTFDIAFARRHATALNGISKRIGLDYSTVDCAETRDGSLLIFEADNSAIVHDMDPPDIFPYKAPQMQRVFGAFTAMLDRRARQSRERAA